MQFLFIFCIFLSLFPTYSKSLIINTSNGKLNGAQIGNAHLFKKIPFAKPPIGKLRFQKPEPFGRWNGVLDATEYGPACMSNSSVTESPQKWIDEDCLHLNIFTNQNCLSSRNCAVIYYIHGGGLQYDSAVMFNDTVLLDTFVSRDVILVIPAFRLGIFSHFVVEDQSIAPTNVALYDILLSLEFVKREIRNFGGDNQKITLFGHSYGGAVAAMMTFSTEFNLDLSLFQQSVSMSSPINFDTLEYQIEKTKTFARHANCYKENNIRRDIRKEKNDTDREMMECLQAKSASELMRIQRHLEDRGYPVYEFLVQRAPLFQETSKKLDFFKNPKKIPVLTGCTLREMDKNLEDKNLELKFDYENPKEVREKYHEDRRNGNYDFQNHTDGTQSIFLHTKVRVDAYLKHGLPIYLYEYTYPKHAYHTDDLFYLMGVHRFEMDENERHLSQVYKSMFINFAKFQEPGFHVAQLENSTYFEVYWNETSGRRPRMSSRFEEAIINYWFHDMVEYDQNITAQKIQGNFSSHKKSPRSSSFSLPNIPNFSSTNSTDYGFLVILIILIIFVTGFMVGRCICPRKRDMYIRLEGDNYK